MTDPNAGPAAPEPGLRERKKRRTRLHIADIATGLFLERGFDQVTVADVARAADVSVNTVFNYFKTKEELFFDRIEEVVEHAAAVFAARRPGESAAAAFRRAFHAGLDDDVIYSGVHPGAERWAATVNASPALVAFQREIGRRSEERLAAALAEATGAGPGDITPRTVAAMIMAVQGGLTRHALDRRLAGAGTEDLLREMHAVADRAFDLLEHGIAGYPATGEAAGPGKDPTDGDTGRDAVPDGAPDGAGGAARGPA
ncbi:TetR/AcrR family transcriptional regulator [Actinomadura parmotrematis]|uniref:TetR/AcrR family transcriptional regulator n=1 Tax=Actinomadura parmotrematis TaxID=2864039 RepID=A0ABS7FQS1_9ACTN|nr:TetR/AcrR family transcriptional regulator [Actinomadura parmotrematis]MBW8482750.1 TetR/AcrR family transcriptional regulator [Actinomadura parmotrematis]